MVMAYTPQLRVEVDGMDRTVAIWQNLNSLSLEDSKSDNAGTLELQINNSPAYSIPRRGAEIRLWMGYLETGLRFIGKFQVDEVSGELKVATMSIKARSAGFATGTEKQKEDVQWENVSLADIAQKIGAKHRYKSKVSVDVQYPYISQTGESDLTFLRRLAQEAGADFSIRDGAIVISPPADDSGVVHAINITDVMRGSYTLKDRNKYSKVKASWWNAKDAREETVEENNENSDEDSAEYVVRRRYSSASEAKTAVKNKMAQLNSGNLELNIAVLGNASYKVNDRASCSDFSPNELNGVYFLTSIRHSFTKTAWETKLTLDSSPDSSKKSKKKDEWYKK